jgi:hypothetical protein
MLLMPATNLAVDGSDNISTVNAVSNAVQEAIYFIDLL